MYLERINLLFGLGRYADAERELHDALCKDADDALAHAMLGTALSHMSRSREAQTELKIAIGLDPTLPYVFYAQALVLMRAGRTRGAIRAVREAIRLDGHDPDYFYILAWLLSSKSRWNESLATVDQGLEIAPWHVASLQLRGHLLHQLGRLDEARQAIDAALAVDPQSADAHHSRGTLLLAEADRAAAEHLLEARRLDPLSKNDRDNIALAVGRQMVPFRWIAPLIPRWNIWRPKATWALFTSLLLVYFALSHDQPPGKQPDLMTPGAQGLFAAITGTVLLLPISFDKLVVGVAQLFEPRRRRHPIGRCFQILGRAFGVAMLSFVMLLVHCAAAFLAVLPNVLLIALVIGMCFQFATDFFRSFPARWTLLLFGLYTVVLGLAWFVPAEVLGNPPDRSIASAIVFAVPAYFSDNVARWIRRRER